MVNWHLSKQGTHWTVSRDHIAGPSWTLSRSAVFEVDHWPGTGCWLDRRLKKGQTLTHTSERGLIFRALSVARRSYTAMLGEQKPWHNIAVVRTPWWLRSYSRQALKRYKLKAECLFLICLGLLFALNCSFWYVLRFLILNLLRLEDAWTAYDRRRETKEEWKRTRTTKRYTSNSLKLVEEVTPQIFFWDTKPFVISSGCIFLKSGLVVLSFVQEWNSNFYCSLELSNNHLYSFWTEIIDLLLVSLALKCERTRSFFTPLA